MQLFDEHQRLTCARLSVPNERRRRDRFGGTQNSFFFQTVDNPSACSMNQGAGQQTAQAQPRVTSVFQGRKASEGSISPMRGARVKSSLMGTSARQKLLQFKLAAHKNSECLQAGDKAAVQSTIEELNKCQKDATPKKV